MDSGLNSDGTWSISESGSVIVDVRFNRNIDPGGIYMICVAEYQVVFDETSINIL